MTDEITRRDVLRGLGGLALTGAIGCGAEGEEGLESDTSASAIGVCAPQAIAAVANRTVAIPGQIQAYAQKSVAAGTAIDFRVHSTVPYTLSVVRLGWDTDGTGRDWTLHSFPQAAAAARVIRPGSYVHVENALNPATNYPQFTVECWVRPFAHAWQGIISQYTYPSTAGFGLFLSDTGQPYYYFGNGGAINLSWLRAGPSAINTMAWTHLAAVLNNGVARLYVNGVQVDTAGGFPANMQAGPSPLRIGAYGDATGTSNFLNGDIAMPAIYSRALSAAEISARATTLPPVPATDAIGCWPLSEETGAVLADASGCGRPGLIVNRGTWMIGGPGFNAAAVPRFGPYNPDTDPARGHGLRLSATDLYDCAWPVSHSYTIPTECLPGVYVGRIIYGSGSRYDVTFIVRKASNRPVAPIVVLCATNTWHAYNYSLGTFSFYANHAANQPTYYQGLEMPWTDSADPYLRYADSAYNYSHLVRAERFTHVWLEQNGYDFDVITDRDLHLNPSILSLYRELFILGHSEYWSGPAFTAVQNYLAAGGKVIMGSGNTMFWRVSFDNGAIECRKLPVNVGGRPNAQWGELYHEHDHQRGGLMREANYPEWQAVGLECVGFDGPHVPYVVTNAAHPYFAGPEAIAVSNGTQIGGPIGVGHEWDARLQSIPGSFTPPIPGSYNPVVLAEGRGNQSRLDYQCNWVGSSNSVISEVIDWQKSGGGRVFAAGSIAAGQALHADNKWAALFRNVMHHNGVRFNLQATAIGTDGNLYARPHDGSSWLTRTWENWGGGFGAHAPTGVQWGPNSLSAMAITAGGQFYYKYYFGSTWSGWNDFGGTFQGRPAAVGWGRNRLDLFARGADNHLYRKAWDGSTWAAWVDLGSSIAGDPAAIHWEGNRLAVAVRGAANNILYKWYVNNTWFPAVGFTDLGGVLAHGPALHSWGGNRMNLFAVGGDGHCYTRHWNSSAWSGWVDLGGALASSVQVGAWGRDQFTIFAVGQDGHLKSKWWDGTNWGPSMTGWSDLGGANLVGEPTVASYRGSHISVLVRRSDGVIQHLFWNGSVWSGWEDLGGTMTAGPSLFRWISG